MKQLSVFVENRKGRLADVLGLIKKAGGNMYALHVADTTDYGIVRIITDNPDKTYETLSQGGFAAAVTEVLAVAMNDEAGALHNIVAKLTEADVSVEYLYAFAGRSGKNPAVVVMKPGDLDAAVDILTKNNYKLVTLEEV